MNEENVNVNQAEKGCQPKAVDTEKADGNEQKTLCKPSKPLSRDNVCINNNAHITRNTQEKSGRHITRVEVHVVDAEPEASVERHLVKRCRAEGCVTFKFASPGNKGVPDRIVVAPGGTVWFVELKRPKGGRLSRMQKYQIGKLEQVGANVRVLKNRREVDLFMCEVFDAISDAEREGHR